MIGEIRSFLITGCFYFFVIRTKKRIIFGQDIGLSVLVTLFLSVTTYIFLRVIDQNKK